MQNNILSLQTIFHLLIFFHIKVYLTLILFLHNIENKAFNMASFISNKQFSDLIPGGGVAKSFKDLSIKKIYKIVRREELQIHDSDNPSLILTLQDMKGHVIKVWAPSRLREQLSLQAYGEELDEQQTLYIRSNGTKECKNDSDRWYYDYDIVRSINDNNYIGCSKYYLS